jgi:hypothetical protein
LRPVGSFTTCAFCCPELDSLDRDISCDGRWVFVELLEDGKAKVNSEPAPTEYLSAIVGQLMESRAERVIYLLPSRGISFYRFVETLKYIGALRVKGNTSVFRLGEKLAGENKPA